MAVELLVFELLCSYVAGAMPLIYRPHFIEGAIKQYDQEKSLEC